MSAIKTALWYWSNILEYGAQMLPCMSAGLVVFWLLRPARRRRLAGLGLTSGPAREGALLIFIMFCAGLASLTLFPANFWHLTHWSEALQGNRPLFPPVDWHIQWDNLQLTPFQEIRRAVHGPWVMFLMVANIGIFVPIGFFPALLWRNWSCWKSILAGFASSVFIEFIQFFIGRSTDVDDVILNTTGSLIGFWIFWLLRALFPKTAEKFQCRAKGV